MPIPITVFRTEGADVYGSFLIGITLKDKGGNVILEKDGNDLSTFSDKMINNSYVAKVKPGKHSLIIPLGSKANLKLIEHALKEIPRGEYHLILTDISGIVWKEKILY